VLVQDAQNIIKALSYLEQLEKIVAELYALAAQKAPAHADFWDQLSQTEVQHAKNMQSLAAIISARPQNFTVGRPVSPVAVNTSIDWIKNNIAVLKSGPFDLRKMLIIARDIEQSILEAKYTEIVKSDDVEYNNIINSIQQDTIVHRKMVEEKINATKKSN